MVFTVVSLALSGMFLFNPAKPEFYINQLASPFMYPAALGGICFMCCVAVALSKLHMACTDFIKHIIIFFGKNSYVVLAFHQVILLILSKAEIGNNGSTQRIIMWILVSLLILFINQYCPGILGRPKKCISSSFSESQTA